MNYRNTLYNIIIFISILSFTGAFVYFFYQLNNTGVLISLLLSIVFFIIIQRFPLFFKDEKHKEEELKYDKKHTTYGLFAIYFISFFASIYFLIISGTSSAIISPWEVVPEKFFIFFFIATFTLLMLSIKREKISIIISIHFLLSFSIALIIYKIGYGFDPFIHEATLDLINKKGLVNPKPFYYLGQYALIIITHKSTFIPIAWLNTILVPFLGAIFIPFAIGEFFRNNKKIKNIITITALIIPFSVFIATTPQNLSFLFLILISLLAFNNKGEKNIFILILSLATASIHPIAGIPALIFSAFLFTEKYLTNLYKKISYLILFCINIVIFPILFFLLNKNNNSSENSFNYTNIFNLPKFIIPGSENFILNFVYLYGFNTGIIFTLLSLTGIFLLWRFKKINEQHKIYIAILISLIFSYVLTRAISFNFLISYEQNNYANRLLFASAIFLLPFALYTISSFLEKIIKENKTIKIPIFIFISLLITSSLYISYPRFDNFFNSRGYSTGKYDITAVKQIEENKTSDYIVLANQQVSAAALKEFGFNRYYKNDIFFYPIPTGGPLYQYYLKMVYEKPTRDIMMRAMDLAEVKEGYLILNKYWWAFPKLIEEAKLEADSWEKIGQDDIYIFKYTK